MTPFEELAEARERGDERRVAAIEEAIVKDNTGLVRSAVKRFGMPDTHEALSLAWLAMTRCIRSYDCRRGIRFSTYYMAAYLRDRRKYLMTRYNRMKILNMTDFLYDPERPPKVPLSFGADHEGRDDIRQMMACVRELTEREQVVLFSRFWRGKTLDDTGIPFGLTRERIRQIQAEALKKLREAMAAADAASHLAALREEG